MGGEGEKTEVKATGEERKGRHREREGEERERGEGGGVVGDR